MKAYQEREFMKYQRQYRVNHNKSTRHLSVLLISMKVLFITQLPFIGGVM